MESEVEENRGKNGKILKIFRVKALKDKWCIEIWGKGRVEGRGGEGYVLGI